MDEMGSYHYVHFNGFTFNLISFSNDHRFVKFQRTTQNHRSLPRRMRDGGQQQQKMIQCR